MIKTMLVLLQSVSGSTCALTTHRLLKEVVGMFVCEKFPRAAKTWYAAVRGLHPFCLCLYRLCGLPLASCSS